MLSSHDHFQFKFHLITQIFYSIDPKNFQKNSNNSFQPIFKSLNITVSFYTDKLTMWDSPWFSLDVVENLIRGKIQNTHVIK